MKRPKRAYGVASACAAAGIAIPVLGGVLGIAAMALGIVGMRRNALDEPSRRSARRGAIFGAAVICISLAEAWGLHAAAEQANRWKCASNMSAIAMACIMYSNGEKAGDLPDSAATLCIDQCLSSDVFLCPSSHDTRAPGSTPQQIRQALVAGGHESYIYCANGLNSKSPSNAVVLYEPLDHHGNGSNVAFADGHVESLPPPAIQQIIREDQRGIRPVLWPPHQATRPGTQP
jgi:prepilin-type processing-associated H-X9-DG protein